MKSFPLPVLLSVLLLPLASCVLAAGAAIGAGAMVALDEDSIQLYLDAGLDDVFAASQAEFRERGALEVVEAGKQEGYLRARVDDTELEVFLTRITDRTTRMVVKARKWKEMMPDLEQAERVADRIAYRVEH